MAKGKDIVKQDGAEKPVKKPRGNSADAEHHITAKREELAGIIRNNVKWTAQPKVRTDEECADRLEQFFTVCAENGELPTVEKMCLALGHTRMSILNWQKGTQGERRAEMISMAKEILAAIDAELVATGKMPAIPYIFRAKNYFGLSDRNETVITHRNESDGLSAEELREKYRASIPAEEREPIDVDFE